MSNWSDLAARMRSAKLHGQALATAGSAREAAREVEALSRLLTQMQQRQDKMSLVLLALVSLVQNKLSLSEEELFGYLERVVQILEQGRSASGGPGRCPRCESAVPAEAARCQFCGAELAVTKPSNPLEELLS